MGGVSCRAEVMRWLVRRDLVANADLAVAEHIGPEATLVDERAEGAGLPRRGGQALQVRARLAQALGEALDVADPEVLADEGVQVDGTCDDVPAGLFRGEPTGREVDAVQHLCLDQREVVPAPVGVGERASLVEVAVALQSAAGPRHGAVYLTHHGLGLWRNHDRLYRAPAARGNVDRWLPERHIGRGDHVADLDRDERLRAAHWAPR